MTAVTFYKIRAAAKRWEVCELRTHACSLFHFVQGLERLIDRLELRAAFRRPFSVGFDRFLILKSPRRVEYA